ncbi:MAG: amidoligase family protein [Oscillospiraceae bacterium]|nr:amidoligase family protein [Oscillospiraceae bacterium]
MFEAKNFGIEVEFTGITRQVAAEAVAQIVRGTVRGGYNYEVVAPDGRVWKLVYDSSITARRKGPSGRRITAGDDYKVELVSPILSYQQDIDTVQALVRKLRKEGGFVTDTAGIHVHLDGAPHTPRTIRNFVNIIASKNDLLYKALQIKAERMTYCKKMDEYLVKRMNTVKPTTFEQIAEIWYARYNENRDQHYHRSRYHFLNLHSFFQGTHTVELRGFNSELHAGKVRSYIVLALALNHQALSQRNASCRKVQEENEKFAMRTYLNRIGFIGDEFKSCREHLCAHLDGCGAWRFGEVNGRSVRTIRTEDDENA